MNTFIRTNMEQMFGKKTFEDVVKNNSLYYSSFMSGVFDGSIEQPEINYEYEMEKDMRNGFFDDELPEIPDYENLLIHYENLVKGKKRYERKQKENSYKETSPVG
jgi:hypothetical protein